MQKPEAREKVFLLIEIFHAMMRMNIFAECAAVMCRRNIFHHSIKTIMNVYTLQEFCNGIMFKVSVYLI